jgi:hypothetical protein
MLQKPVIALFLGIILVIAGAVYPAYSIPLDFYDKDRKKFTLSRKYITAIEDFIVPPWDSRVYRYLERLVSKFEVDLTIQRLWLCKVLCTVVSFAFLIVVSITNTGILRENIMGSWWQEMGIMNTITPEEYRYNVSLYKEVLSRIGEENLRKISDEEKVAKISQVLQDIKGGNYASNGKGEAFVSAYKNIEGIRVISTNIILIAAISFFIPEILLFLRTIIVGRKYKNEAIKMENIFGLLGSLEDYKTIYIIKDMANASKLFNKQLDHAATIFYMDKNKCFEYLKKSIREKSFIRLVDVMRIYSTVDKKLALTILERNLKEHEEQLLLSAEEDMDVVDILAFMSVIPILYEMANLMITPMMDVIFKVFNFI